MKKDFNLSFIRSKIDETKTALCSFHLENLSPASFIVHTDSVDEQGYIEFRVTDRFPAQIKQQLDLFGLTLFYYKKGLGYHLSIETMASARDEMTNADLNTLIVRARILGAEYTEGKNKTNGHRPGLLGNFRYRVSQMAASIFV